MRVEIVSFQIEKFSETIEEAKPLLLLHWQEIARNKDLFPLDPDYATYAALERAGYLRIFTLRSRAAQLVGYASYMVHKNLHYKTMICAESDIFWLSPEVRRGRNALKFFSFIEHGLAAEGVHLMHTTYKSAHPAAGRVLEHLGHIPIEIGCSKVLVR